MVLNIRTSADQEFEGICPECKEWTTAGESCCGAGAFIEGGHVSDESALETKETPTVAIRVLENVPMEVAKPVHSALFRAGVSSCLWSYGNGNSDKWNVTVHVYVSALPGDK